MKRRQVKLTQKNAKQANVNKSAEKAVVSEAVEEVEEVAAKKPKKISVKVQEKVVEEVIKAPQESDEIEEDSEEVEEERDSEEPMDEEVEDQDSDDAGDDQEENGDDDDDGDNDNDDDDNDDDDHNEEDSHDDDDEEPTEEPIDEEPTIPSKVKSGKIPESVPNNKIVDVHKLPKKCKQIDIVQAFAKYGAIDQVHIVTTAKGSVASVAFKTAKAAKAALKANKKVKVHDCLIEVGVRKQKKGEKEEKINFDESRDRTVYVKYLKRDTTEDQLKEHFADCGEIERCKIVVKNSIAFAFVTFINTDSVKAAKKLHNSILNQSTIGVYENTSDTNSKLIERDPKLTIMLKNKQRFDSVSGETLGKIFDKCGEVDNMDILCKKNILAFISFKDVDGVKNALKLNGKFEQGVDLEIEEYDPYKKKVAIYVSNLPRDCTEDELRKHFSKAGEIVSIVLRTGFAIIHFTDSDAYCKSFLLNESYIRNKIIFLEPHSPRKQSIIKAKVAKRFKNNRGRKPRAENGKSVFQPKKPQSEQTE